MYELYTALLKEKYGDWYEFNGEELDTIYTVYNKFSKEDGCTKLDMRKVAPCLNLAFQAINLALAKAG